MSLINNERAKLSATYLNGIAIAIIAVGGLAPMIATLNGPSPPSLSGTSAVGGICILISAILHFIARAILGSLR